MFKFVRKIVAGPKNRTVEEQFDLDLTYITKQVIAMAFPASGIQKAYRNPIKDVVNFLNLKHGQKHYLIINTSNRKYDYEPFNNQVLQFFWTDHQAPPITTLFELCEQVMCFLEESPKNVVAVHCNHGKGRTGTAIISYLLYSGQFSDVKSVLHFYNNKRFMEGKYAVDQPCQLRYISYFNSFLQLPIDYLSQPLKAFKLVKVTQKGLKDKQLYIRISQTRTENVIYPQVPLNDNEIKFSRPLVNDIFIQLLENGWSGIKQLLRINFNLFFLSKDQEKNRYQVCFLGDEIKMKHKQENFELILQFEQFCHCHLAKQKKEQCLCFKKRQRQQTHWDDMIKIIEKNKSRHLLQNESKGIYEAEKQKNTKLESDELNQFQQM